MSSNQFRQEFGSASFVPAAGQIRTQTPWYNGGNRNSHSLSPNEAGRHANEKLSELKMSKNGLKGGYSDRGLSRLLL